MKKNISLLSGILTLLLLTQNVLSQSSATWSLTSNGNASVSGSLNAGAVSTGPGYRSGGISSMSYNSNGVSSTNWIGYSYSQFSITSSYYNKDYYQYTVSPSSGNSFTVGTISYEVSASTAPVSWYAYYSLDGFNTYTALGSRNATSHTGLNINVPEGSTFTLRIYGMDLVSTSTAFRNKNVVISGSSTPSCVSQTANAGTNLSVCKGQTTSSLGGNVGGSATSGVWTSNSGGAFTPNATDLNATWTPSSEFTGNATLTLTTTNGCSTHVSSTKTVTVNNTVQVNNPQTICQGGSYSINGNTYTSAGTYTDVLQTQSGCDSTVITTLTVQQVTLSDVVSNTQNGTTLVASATQANYQWINCNDATAIAGATSQSFVPQESGNYSVVITSSTCPSVTVTSRCISINKDNVGIAGTLQVAGLSEFEKKVTMREGLVLEGVESDSIVDSDSSEVSFLFLKGGDGTVKKGGIGGLVDMMYAERFYQCIDPHFPVWSNKENVLYTGTPCNANVGIGTNAPEGKLHVVGQTVTNTLRIGRTPASGGLITGYRQGTTNFSLLKLGQYNPQTQTEFTAFDLMSNGELTLNRNDNGNFLNLRNGDQNVSIFTIDVNGNLRLRNTSREIFHVNANSQTVFARKIVVDEQTWPDYVFEKDYKLRPLSEVKEFIEENGHLPNIPSRETVLKEGVDLGSMVNILVEKVEELTLYSIQQQEEIERLKQLLKQQQETNK